MLDKENTGVLSLRVWGNVWLAWFLTALLLLSLFSLFISQTATSEQTMAYISSAISFFAACAAGRSAEIESRRPPLLIGLVCSLMITLPLLLCGFLFARERLSSDAVLSVVSLSVAGALFGSVFLGFQTKKRPHRHSSTRRKSGKTR